MEARKIKPMMIAAAMTLCAALSGCTFGEEPNDIAYITALGIDKTSYGGEYNITIQFAKPAMISGGASEEGGKGEDIIEHLTVEAPTIYAALSLGNKVISKTFSTEHLSLIVISEDIGSEDAGMLIKSIVGDKDIRPETFFAVARDGARGFIEGVEPVIEINPVRYYRMILGGHNAKSITNTDIYTFYLNMLSDCRDTIVPVAGMMETESGEESESGGESQSSGNSESSGESQSSGGSESGGESQPSESAENSNQEKAVINTDPFEWGIRDYTAGEIAIDNANKSELAAGAVFSGGRLAGYIGTTEVKALSLMTGGDYTMVTINTFGEPVSLYVSRKRPVKVTVDVSSETPIITARLSLKGAMTYTPEYFSGGMNVADFESAAAEAVENKLTQTLYILRDMGSDAVGFGKYAKLYFTADEFKEYGWRDKYRNAEINVTVDFTLEHMGV